jgi:selenocysteine lyase/cysteine desulfurase
MQAIGLEHVADHCRALAARLRAGLRQFPNVTLLGPTDPARTTGLIGFTVQGWTADDCKALVARLYRQQRILIKYQPEHIGLRVSIAAFNTAEDVDKLLDALEMMLGN